MHHDSTKHDSLKQLSLFDTVSLSQQSNHTMSHNVRYLWSSRPKHDSLLQARTSRKLP